MLINYYKLKKYSISCSSNLRGKLYAGVNYNGYSFGDGNELHPETILYNALEFNI